MASTLFTVSFCSLSSVGSTKTTMYSLPQCSCSSSSCSNSCLKTLNFFSSSRFSQMGLCQFTPWNGLKQMGISISAKPQKLGKAAKCRGKVVYASLFGVGAPEALVIGVVALLVFGPKGLAEVARNLGKTLRAFQPTIRELQDVSREFKSTLEREIGLDDDPRQKKKTSEVTEANFTSDSSISNSVESQTVPMADPNGSLSNDAYTSEEYLKITEEQLKAQQELMSSPPENQVEPENQPQDLQQDVMSSSPESQFEPESQTQAVEAQQDVVVSSSESMIEPEGSPQAGQQDAVLSPSENTVESENPPQAVQAMATSGTSVQKSESES